MSFVLSKPEALNFQNLLSFNSADRLQAAKHFSSKGILGLAPLLLLMRDYDIPVRDRAFSDFKSSARSDLKPILLLLANEDPKVRALASSALRRLGSAAKEPLLRMLLDGDHLIRSYALYAISQDQSVDEELFEKALMLSDDPSEYVRKRVSDVISAHGDIDLERSRRVVDLLLMDNNRMVVVAAIDAVKCFPVSESTHFALILKSLLDSPLPDISDVVRDAISSIEGAR